MNDKEESSSAKTIKSKKNTIVEVVVNQKNNVIEHELKTKPLDIRLYRLQESKGDYSQDDIAKTKKISKEEKSLMITKKKGTTLVPFQRGVQKRRREPKNGKFQLKIKHTERREMDEKEEDDEDEARVL